jgi:diguanylate cyclase (GGDEF)-like protein
MPDAQLDAVADRAQRICDEIKLETFQFDGVTLAPITVSAGIAVYPLHGKTIASVLRMADTALYEAKRKGRDQVALAVLGQEMDIPNHFTTDQTSKD